MTKSEFERRLVDALETLSGDAGAAFTETYLFQAQDFGAGDAAEVIQGPSGKTGIVRAVTVFNVSEAFTIVTTSARVDVGDGSDANGYAFSNDIPAVAIAGSHSPAISAGVLGNELPGGAAVTLTFVAPTGGTPAGIADVQVTITWK
jgi:hypothetical protein